MSSRARALGAQVLLVGSVLGLFVLYSVHAALPPNVLELPLERSVEPRKWAPQGWAFFTRNPREPRVLPFVAESGTWRSANLGPHAQARYAFGLDRKSRAQGVEVGLLMGGLSGQEQTGQQTGQQAGQQTECDQESDACTDRSSSRGEIGLLLGSLGGQQWTECDEEPIACIDQLPVETELVNVSPSPTLCGQVAFAKQEQLPWAWAASGGEETMPSEVVRLEVACSKS